MSKIHFSGLKNIDQSPAHYLLKKDTKFKASPLMDYGSLVHCLVFNHEEFDNKFAVFEGLRRAGKVWTQFKEDNEDKIIVKSADVERAIECLKVLKEDPVVWPLLAEGIKERKMDWTVGKTDCQGTPDTFTDEAIVDLKVTAYGSPDEFPRMCRKFLYHAQVAWYQFGVEQNFPAPQERLCYIVTVAHEPPFNPVGYWLTHESIRLGTAKYLEMLSTLNDCLTSGQWPGYSREIIELNIWPDEALQPLTLNVRGKEITV